MFLMENNWFDNVSLDIDQTPTIIRVLDAGEVSKIMLKITLDIVDQTVEEKVITCCLNQRPISLISAVIKMEGGTDNDLRILDMPSEEEEEREKSASASGSTEPPKREDLKGLDADCKPSVEKDKNEKVCVVLCQRSPSSKHFTVLCL